MINYELGILDFVVQMMGKLTADGPDFHRFYFLVFCICAPPNPVHPVYPCSIPLHYPLFTLHRAPAPFVLSVSSVVNPLSMPIRETCPAVAS